MPSDVPRPLLRDRLMRCVLGAQVAALFIGTMMPGGVRNRIQDNVEQGLTVSGLHLSSMAHLVLFACMAFTASRRPFHWPALHVLLAALALALVSEGLQHFAIDRHPRWIDVGIDMAGALAGLGLSGLVSLCFSPR